MSAPATNERVGHNSLFSGWSIYRIIADVIAHQSVGQLRPRCTCTASATYRLVPVVSGFRRFNEQGSPINWGPEYTATRDGKPRWRTDRRTDGRAIAYSALRCRVQKSIKTREWEFTSGRWSGGSLPRYHNPTLALNHSGFELRPFMPCNRGTL